MTAAYSDPGRVRRNSRGKFLFFVILLFFSSLSDCTESEKDCGFARRSRRRIARRILEQLLTSWLQVVTLTEIVVVDWLSTVNVTAIVTEIVEGVDTPPHNPC